MKKKILSILLAGISALSFMGCSSSYTPTAPENKDYKDSTKQFEFYGYSAASNGEWTIDGIKYSAGEDFRTLERMIEYKECGMSIYFPQHQAMYKGEEWETSQTKKTLDMCVEAGLKCIINDGRIQPLSKRTTSVIGEGDDQFASLEALDKEIASYMAPYKDHPAFYGLMLGDEPFYNMATAYGEVYKSIERVDPDCFIQYNLNPITAGQDPSKIDQRFPKLTSEEAAGKNTVQKLQLRYEKYLALFLDATGAPYIQYDQYPLKKAKGIDEYYILGLQTAARMAKERGLEFYFVSQTYGQTDGNPNPRMLKEADLYWLNNMLVGFGIKQISYFTYWTKSDNNTEHFIDGNSFITWNGDKTNIYYWMQKIMAEEQQLAPTILNFDYNTSKVVIQAPTAFDVSHARNTIETPEFTVLKDVIINKEIALVTELYDAEKDNYMYMVQNIVDPYNKGSKVFQTAQLTFGDEYKYAEVWTKGVREFVVLGEGGTLIVKNKPGDAVYVRPYNA